MASNAHCQDPDSFSVCARMKLLGGMNKVNLIRAIHNSDDNNIPSDVDTTPSKHTITEFVFKHFCSAMQIFVQHQNFCPHQIC
jgi:hypothetical protein